MKYTDIKTGAAEELTGDLQGIGFVSSAERIGITTHSSSSIYKYDADETRGASEETVERRKVPLAGHGKAGNGELDKSLLKRAKSIIDSFNCDDVMEATVYLESLRGIVLQLWESATTTTQFHQEILAILESAILPIDSPNRTQLSVFREAIMDLGSDVLTQAHVEVIRRQFINEGFSPLALLSEIEDGDDCD